MAWDGIEKNKKPEVTEGWGVKHRQSTPTQGTKQLLPKPQAQEEAKKENSDEK